MRKHLFELVLSAMLGTIMFVSKLVLEFLPNIHLLGVFIVAFTVVFRTKALVSIYVFVLMNGVFSGFTPWWFPYLYVWTILWGIVMLLPKNMSKKVAIPTYMAVCGLHGFLFGVLYAPAQAIMFGLSFKSTLTWIATGLPFDLIHGISNILLGVLIVPIVTLLKKITKPHAI